MSEYWTAFVRESEEQITKLNNELLELENDPDDEEAMEGIFRTAHTLKGNCGAMGLARASDLAHAIEDLLDSARSGSVQITPEFMDTIFDGVDELETMIERADARGEVERDPSPTIEALRSQISYVDSAPEISPPTDEEIDAVLARFDPPTDDDHDAFLVRLSIEPNESVNNGLLVVTALIDAFELIGTDPSQEAIENDEYGRKFDAVFGSAVGETAIAAALEPVDAVADFVIETVTERLAAASESPGIERGTVGANISTEEAEDLSVDDLLGEFDELDDLDAMVEETADDDLDVFDEMGDAGTFDDLLGDETGYDDGESAAEAPDGVDDASDDGDVADASAVFNELKDEVDMVGFDELQDELDELEFDEFDSDDEVDMDELLGDDIDTEDNSFLDVETTTPKASNDELEGGESTADDDAFEEFVIDEDGSRGEGDAEDDIAPEEDAPDESAATANGAALEEADDLDDVDFDPPEERTVADSDSDFGAEKGPATSAHDDADESGDATDDGEDAGVGEEFPSDEFGASDPGEFETAGSDQFEASFGERDGFDDEEIEATLDDTAGFEDEGFGDEELDGDTEFGAGVGEPESDIESFTTYDEADSFGETDEEFDHRPETDDGFDDGFDDASSDDDSASVERIFEESPRMKIPDISVPELPSESRAGRGSDEPGSVRVGTDQIDTLLTLVEGLVTSRVRLRHAIETGEDPGTIDTELDGLDDITSELQETVMDVRLVPLETVTNRLPRVVRDIAREQGKEIEFEVSGEGIEVDRSILDQIGDPLVHLVRNAVDHGIEPPEDREEADKARTGTIAVRAERTRDRVTIEVEDDGSGLDPETVRAEAVEAGVITESAADQLADEALSDLIFQAGLSTADEVTDVSGRGVGMDVVKRTIDDLDGTVALESEPGSGTTVTMTLPVTVAISDVLFLECGGEEFGVPVKTVDEITTADSVETVDGADVVVVDEAEIPVVHLDDALSTPAVGANGDGMVVSVRTDTRSVALHCDQVHGQQEVVVKPFEGFMGNIPGLSGATVRGRGKVVNILDVNTL